MSLFLLVMLCLLVFVIGFFTGAVLLALMVIDRINRTGRFTAGPVAVVGFLERRNDDWE